MSQLVSKSIHIFYNLCYKHFLYPKLYKRLSETLAGSFVQSVQLYLLSDVFLRDMLIM